jgi:hypothetical protein
MAGLSVEVRYTPFPFWVVNLGGVAALLALSSFPGTWTSSSPAEVQPGPLARVFFYMLLSIHSGVTTSHSLEGQLLPSSCAPP